MDKEAIIKIVEESLENLLTLLGEKEFHLQTKAGEEDDLTVTIESPNPGLLIGYRGKTLEALQLVLKLIVAQKTNQWYHLTVDINSYRVKQKERVLDIARRAAWEVKATKRPVSLIPMSPYERRLIHIYFKDDNEVETVSEGESSQRRVIIKPKE